MHIVVTGASSGLGEALSEELARRGHAVGLVARRADALAAVAGRIREAGGRAATAVADVTDRAALTAAIASLAAELGPVDVVVANAGGGRETPAARLDADEFTAMMRLNYDGVVHSFAAVLPDMLARGSGQLVAVSSMAGLRGLPGAGAYSACKAAVTTLLESLSIELRPRGIAVTAIHPGFVATPPNLKARHPLPFLMSPPDAARRMADGILARRRRVDFPLPMVLLIGIARSLPLALWEAVARRIG